MKGSKTIEPTRFPLMRQLRAERQRRGIRLIELAHDVGYHRTALGNWERGKHLPTLDALDNWCQALGLNLSIDVTP